MSQFYVIINVLASLNASILFCLLFFRKNNTLPNFALSVVMLVPALYFANSLLMLQGIFFPILFFVVQFIAILYAPMIAIYVYALLGKSMRQLQLLYVLSALIGCIPIYLFVEYLGWDTEQQVQFYNGLIHKPYPDRVTLYSVIFYTFQQLAFIYLLVVIIKAKKKAYQYFSNIDRHKIRYLQNFMTLLVILNFLIVGLYVSFDILFVEYLLIPIVVTIIYVFLTYYAFKNNAIYTREGYRIYLQENIPEEMTSTTISEPNQYSDVVREVKIALANPEVLKDSSLTIKKLAKHLNIPIGVLSKSINQELNSNFYDLVNSKRVEASKKLLASDTNHTIEAIGYEVGFNSRATFYRAFKKYTSMTPTAYIQSRKKAD